MSATGKVRGEEEWDKEAEASLSPSTQSPPPGLTTSMSPAKKGRRGSVEILQHFQNRGESAMQRLEREAQAEIGDSTARTSGTGMSAIPLGARHGRRRSVAETFGGR